MSQKESRIKMKQINVCVCVYALLLTECISSTHKVGVTEQEQCISQLQYVSRKKATHLKPIASQG